MPKTDFINGDASQGLHGTRVAAEFLNALNSHYHTGLDEDGHGALAYAADTGSANAYIVNLNPALTEYVSGMPLFFMAANASTGAATINVNGLGVKTIKKSISQDLGAGDIQAGQVMMVIYDGTNFQLIGGLNADTIDGFHASATAAANTIPVLNSSAKLSASITGDADTVDGFHASATAAANTVPVLNASAKLPASITGDADTVDGFHASVTPAANIIPVLDSSAMLPVSITGDANTLDGYHASATPTVNMVPVRDGNKDLTDRNSVALFGLSDEQTALSSSNPVSTSSMNVTAGDRIMVQAACVYSSLSATTAVKIGLYKASGTASIIWGGGDSSTAGPASFYTNSSSNTQGTMTITVFGIARVTGTGTLTLQASCATIYGNAALGSSGLCMYVGFLKKQ